MNNLAFVIGCEKYTDDELCDLDGVNVDVDSMRNVLIKHCGCSKKNVFVISDQPNITNKPTFTGIFKMLQQKNRDFGNTQFDTVFLYFSGHGCLSENDVCLLPTDSIPNPSFECGITAQKNILKALKEFNCQHIILFLDICQREINSKSTSTKGTIGTKSPEKGTVIFYSCLPGKDSFMIPSDKIKKYGAGSIFTKCLIEALQQREVHTVKDTSEYVKNRMQEICKDLYLEQNPHTTLEDDSLANLVITIQKPEPKSEPEHQPEPKPKPKPKTRSKPIDGFWGSLLFFLIFFTVFIIAAYFFIYALPSKGLKSINTLLEEGNYAEAIMKATEYKKDEYLESLDEQRESIRERTFKECITHADSSRFCFSQESMVFLEDNKQVTILYTFNDGFFADYKIENNIFPDETIEAVVLSKTSVLYEVFGRTLSELTVFGLTGDGCIVTRDYGMESGSVSALDTANTVFRVEPDGIIWQNKGTGKLFSSYRFELDRFKPTKFGFITGNYYDDYTDYYDPVEKFEVGVASILVSKGTIAAIYEDGRLAVINDDSDGLVYYSDVSAQLVKGVYHTEGKDCILLEDGSFYDKAPDYLAHETRPIRMLAVGEHSTAALLEDGDILCSNPRMQKIYRGDGIPSNIIIYTSPFTDTDYLVIE